MECFSFLEKEQLLEKVMEATLGVPIKSPEIIYWSHETEGMKLLPT